MSATANGTTLELTSTAYGSDAFVDLQILTEGTGTVPSGTFTTAVGAGSRATGTDIVAKVNGIDANGSGNTLSINTVDAGPEVRSGGRVHRQHRVHHHRRRCAVPARSRRGVEPAGPHRHQQRQHGSARWRRAACCTSLASGGSADLATDANTAAKIVEEAINQVTTLRGRLGAFQRTLLETNKNALSDTLVNLTDAESQIRDADFAAETAALTRAQILVQSGTTVLQIANQNPQNVLALLR